MSRLITAIAVLLVSTAASYGQVATSAKIDEVIVAAVPMTKGVYQITVKGKVTLGTNDTYEGFLAYALKPDGTTQVPLYVTLMPPAAGQTANFTAFVSGQTTLGDWVAVVSVAYSTNGPPIKPAGDRKAFTVP